MNIKKLSQWFFKLVRLNNNPAVKLYAGFGNNTHCFVSGHALARSPFDRKTHRNNFLYDTLSLLRLFMVKPIAAATLQMQWDDKTYCMEAESDGFFTFEWQPSKSLPPGRYTVQVDLIQKESGSICASAQASLTIFSKNQYSFISDIDDTFLVSHSAHLLKRLWVLLTKNPHSRRPFEGVVEYYQLLQSSNNEWVVNPFFYVSSSEWNLYAYIREFSKHNKLPDGVYFLSKIKQFKQLFKTGQTNHNTKFGRIEKLIQAFADQKFVLLGDDSQQDPNIYAAIVAQYPCNIFCVYIRSSIQTHKPAVENTLKTIAETGTICYYFYHSADAIAHAKQIGLISE